MTCRSLSFLIPVAFTLATGLVAGACGVPGHAQEGEEAPLPAVVEKDESASGVAKVDHPEAFPLAAAETHEARPALSVTGVVTVDVSRAVPVMALASGRALEVHARLGDQVKRGQLLVRVKSNDISSAFSNYRHAVADEALARAQLERSKRLYDRGAIAEKDLEVAQDTEDKALVDVQTATDSLRVLGVPNPEQPHGDISIVDVTAPASGWITEQNVTNAAPVRSLDTSNLFTIADMTHMWVVCDVYENDLPNVQIGDKAEIRLNAYPERPVIGRVSNILPTLDAAIRTAKVRVEVENPGFMRVGMFVTATFFGQTTETRVVVPSTAILRLHDRDWAYVPAPGNAFRRVEVVSGNTLPGGLQEVKSGLLPGQNVVLNALVLDRAIEQ